MAKITKTDRLAQRITDDLVRNGVFSDRAKAMKHAREALTLLRQGFTKPVIGPTDPKLPRGQETIKRWQNAWRSASDIWAKGVSGSSISQRNYRSLANIMFRTWKQELKTSPNFVQKNPTIVRYLGIAERNIGFKGSAKKGGKTPTQQGLTYNKNIDATDLERTRTLHAQRFQAETQTGITAGQDPSKAPKTLVKAPEQQYPSTTQTPSTAPSKQGQMLKKADLTNPAGVAEANYERDLMRTAMEEGESATKKKLEKQSGVKHSKSSWTKIWEKMSKAMQEANLRTGGGPTKGGSNPTKHLTGGKMGINDHIKLL